MENTCCSCLKPSAGLHCGICKEVVCKKCAQFVEPGRFSFLAKLPAELIHSVYCPFCFDAKVAPLMAEYDETMERAHDIAIFFKEQSKETRLMSRKEKPFKVQDCSDRDETLLRLAFFAAQGNFNCLIDVDLTSKKVREGAYQTQIWNGTGIPTQVSAKKL